MTAVIGIMNKNGIALAADSAVTVTGGNQKKIYNTANKLFALSKYNPVAIMVYDSSTFQSTPWETIIKLYRKNLGENNFDTIKDYKDDFVKYLKDNDFFSPPKNQLHNLKQFIYWNLNITKDEIVSKMTPNQTDPQIIAEFQTKLLEKATANIATYDGTGRVIPEFVDYTLENFKTYFKDSLKDVTDIIFEGIEITEPIENALLEQYYLHLRSPSFIGLKTGVVFAGFGEKEIYPSISSILIADVVDNRLRIDEGYSDKISNENNGSIAPFAQTDVINMFIKGIDPQLDKTYLSTFRKVLEKFTAKLIEIIEPENIDLAGQIAAIDLATLTKEFNDEIKAVQSEKQIYPTIDTVAILSKEDLAEMAESLIYLTYLKRRISSDEESVGGPIDVAIISKGDGFIWKKRKHYFEEQLNKQFLANYFKQ